MRIKSFFSSVFFVTILLFSFSGNFTYGILSSLSSDKSASGRPLSFLSSIEIRKDQLRVLQKEKKQLQQLSTDRVKAIKERLSSLEKELGRVKSKLRTDIDHEEIELLKKHVTLLNERKQNLVTTQDVQKEIEDSVEKQIKVVTNIIGFLTKKKYEEGLKALYSWQEFRDEQLKIAETSGKIKEETALKDDLAKQKNEEQETIGTLQKQIDVRTQERDRKIEESKIAEKQVPFVNTIVDNFDLEINLLKEKIELAQLRVKRLDVRIRLKESEIDFLAQQHSRWSDRFVTIEKRLALSYEDVENAKDEASAEREKSLRIKEVLDKKINIKKLEKNRQDLRQDFLQKQLKELEDTKQKDTIKYYLTLSELKKVEGYKIALQGALDLWAAKKNSAEVAASTKELRHQMVDLRYKLTEGIQGLTSLQEKFKNQRDLALKFSKGLIKHKESVDEALVATSRESAHLKTIKGKVLDVKNTMFRVAPDVLQRILLNLRSAKKHLDNSFQFSRDFLAINSDLRVNQDKINNQYDLILNDLENQIVGQQMWRRSPRALSFEQFTQSLLEAESFFKQFFWDTPQYLGPTQIIRSIKSASLHDLLFLLLFFVFFFVLFFTLKYTLRFLLKKATKRIAADHQHLQYLSLNILLLVLNFMLKHLVLLFSWFFLVLHIAFKFRYIFSTIYFLDHPYYLALFYLLSIPILVYLSRSFLSSIKELNKRLSFLFFAEKLQDRFILLITFFCYSTAILMPLRLAFLHYFPDLQTIFPNVIFAAYSLILVTVLLFFFSREDVLRLIPSRFIWLKNQINTYYYPVFFFVIGLLILSNPYIGYLNLAWYLAFVVPLSTFLIYSLFSVHYYIRKYAVFLFMKEEDEEITDKFEHAKTYYGLLVILSFLILLFLIFIFVARIWGYTYAPADLWKLFSEVWVIPVGHKYTLGFLDLIYLVLFISGGFLLSSLVYKFVLSKLFDILRVEPGTQNTFSKILHYLTISLGTLLGFIFIHLEGLFWYVGTSLAVAAGLALKDIVTDYIAGFFVLIERPLEIGNFVDIGKDGFLRGTVHKIDARTTTIMTRLNHSQVIPNKDLITLPVVNWGKGRFAVGFELKIHVDYRTDPELARKSILEVVQANPTILRIPSVVVRLDDLEENGLYFMSRAFISARRVKEQWDIAADLRMALVKTFRERSIDFAFPQHVLHWQEKNLSQREPSGSPIQFKFDQ